MRAHMLCILVSAACSFAVALTPTLECIQDNGDGSMSVVWGYDHPTGPAKLIASGPDNKLVQEGGPLTQPQFAVDSPRQVVCQEIELVDINKDGHVDILCNSVTEHLTALINPGTGRIHSWERIVIAGAPMHGQRRGMHFGDLDNDSDIDIVFGMSGLGKGKGSVHWLENSDGHGKVWRQHTVPCHPSGCMSDVRDIAVFDLDNDLDLDMCVVDYGHSGKGNVVCFENRGLDGWMWHLLDTGRGEYGSFIIKAADMNNDGLLDPVIVTDWNSQIAYYVKPAVLDGQNPWGKFKCSNEMERVYHVELADINGDGWTDVLATDQSEYMHIFISSNSGTDWTDVPIQTHGPGTFYAKDVDHDGDLDLIVNAIKMTWWENIDGTGRRWIFEDFSDELRDHGSGNHFRAGDVDGDGIEDLVAERNEDGVFVWRGVGVTPIESFSPGRHQSVGVTRHPVTATPFWRITEANRTVNSNPVSETTPICCGNGFHDAIIEQCDDGNAVSGDGCSATCRLEPSCNLVDLELHHWPVSGEQNTDWVISAFPDASRLPGKHADFAGAPYALTVDGTDSLWIKVPDMRSVRDGSVAVHAAADGKVIGVRSGVATRSDCGAPGVTSIDRGNWVRLQHANGFFTEYSNMRSDVNVRVGDTVVAGDVLGYAGASGCLMNWPGVVFRVQDCIGSHVDPFLQHSWQSSARIGQWNSPTNVMDVHIFDGQQGEETLGVHDSDVPTEESYWTVGREMTIRGYVASDVSGGTVRVQITYPSGHVKDLETRKLARDSPIRGAYGLQVMDFHWTLPLHMDPGRYTATVSRGESYETADFRIKSIGAWGVAGVVFAGVAALALVGAAIIGAKRARQGAFFVFDDKADDGEEGDPKAAFASEDAPSAPPAAADPKVFVLGDVEEGTPVAAAIVAQQANRDDERLCDIESDDVPEDAGEESAVDEASQHPVTL